MHLERSTMSMYSTLLYADGIRERAGAGTHKETGSIGLHWECGAWTELGVQSGSRGVESHC